MEVQITGVTLQLTHAELVGFAEDVSQALIRSAEKTDLQIFGWRMSEQDRILRYEALVKMISTSPALSVSNVLDTCDEIITNNNELPF